MVPQVGSAEEAAQVVAAARYPPVGRRGYGMIFRDDWSPDGVAETLEHVNREVMTLLQIETAAGLEAVDEIAAVDGVDCLWIGHFDLSSSLGIPGQFAHPKFVNAVERIVAAARRHGKALGRLVPDAASGIDHAKMGFDFVCWSGDVWALQEAVRGGIEAIRTGTGPAMRKPNQARA
jgi:2-dehydro-3-deoxyglucarate aldolase/4-hydroxy-2-oxoheptanedioate aldolase